MKTYQLNATASMYDLRTKTKEKEMPDKNMGAAHLTTSILKAM